MILVLELKVELLAHVGRENFDLTFGKSLTEANATATMEGNPAIDVTLRATRSQTKRVTMIKPLG